MGATIIGNLSDGGSRCWFAPSRVALSAFDSLFDLCHSVVEPIVALTIDRTTVNQLVDTDLSQVPNCLFHPATN
jgi:hypothetical protein